MRGQIEIEIEKGRQTFKCRLLLIHSQREIEEIEKEREEGCVCGESKKYREGRGECV